MGFWIYMLIMDLLIPLSMVIFGLLFMKKAPMNINYLFGYRTEMSMKNRDTWIFAHQHCGKYWFRWGFILIPLTVAAMVFVLGRNEDVIGTVGAIICGVQMIPMIGCIVSTEKALNHYFDKNGILKAEK